MDAPLQPQSILSIDYLSVSGTIGSTDETQRQIDAILVEAGYPPPRWHPLGIYETGFRIPRIGAVFLGHCYPPIRTLKGTTLGSFHFNPNLCDFATVRRILALFSGLRVTRTDIAVDLIHPDASCWNVIQTRLSETSRESSSVRYGQSSGDRQLLLYDKTLERTDKHRRAIHILDIFGVIHSFDAVELQKSGYGWLRVEARLRKTWIRDNHVKPGAFKDLFVVPGSPDTSCLGSSATREARLLGFLAKPALYSAFTSARRRALREDLRDCEYHLLPVPSPFSLYDEHYQDVLDALDRLLGLEMEAAA